MILTIEATTGYTVYGIIRNSNDLVANGTGTEIYNQSDWASQYANGATEQGTSGHYYLAIPSYLPVGDNYNVTFFRQLGGSPDPSDTKLGAQNFNIADSTPSPTVPTDLIERLRILGNDTETSNLVNRETLKPAPDGIRKKFYLDNKPVVTASVYITQGNLDAGFRSQSGFSVDVDNAIITFTTAPTTGTQPFVADYNFNWFTDTDYAEFLNEAARQVSATDPNDVIDGLTPALLQFSLYYYWMRRASQYAHRYGSTGGMAGQSVEEVTKNFRELAKLAWDAGTKAREEYYKGMGAQFKASTAVINYAIDPYTPIR